MGLTRGGYEFDDRETGLRDEVRPEEKNRRGEEWRKAAMAVEAKDANYRHMRKRK